LTWINASFPGMTMNAYLETKCSEPMMHRLGMRQWLGLITIALPTLVASPCTAAQYMPDAAAGRSLAEKWCTSCHVVSPTQDRATSTGAPPFATIADMKSTTAIALQAFLQTPHWRMPDLHLTRDEIADITAYILSMRQE
jgi:cytochrome c